LQGRKGEENRPISLGAVRRRCPHEGPIPSEKSIVTKVLLFGCRPLAARDWLTPLGGTCCDWSSGIDWCDVITSSLATAAAAAVAAADVCCYSHVIYWIIMERHSIGRNACIFVTLSPTAYPNRPRFAK